MIGWVTKSGSPINMCTNIGMKIINQEAQLPGHSTVYYMKDGIANILSQLNLIKRAKVIYDSKKEDAYIVSFYDTGETIKFKNNG